MYIIQVDVEKPLQRRRGQLPAAVRAGLAQTSHACQPKFQDLLNQCISNKLLLRKHLFEVQPQPAKRPDDNRYQLEVNEVKQQIEQMLNYQKNLQIRFDQVSRAKLLLEKKLNQLRDVERNIREIDVRDVQKKNEEVVNLLTVTTTQMGAFQQLTEQYKQKEVKQQELRKKEIEKDQEELRSQELKIAMLKQKLKNQKLYIQQLKEEEEFKIKRNHESFKIGDYIEFFMEIKMQFVDQIQESESASSQPSVISPSRNRGSTRNEIVTMLEEFFIQEDLNQVVDRTIELYREMIAKQNTLTSEYNQKIEEKQVKAKLLKELSKAVALQQSDTTDYIGLIPQRDSEITLNQALTEGPTVMHENLQLSYHIKINQFCLISVYMRIVDMLQRMCLGLVWLQETSKMAHHQIKQIDAICMRFLSTYSKPSQIQLFIPKPKQPGQKLQRQGSFITLSQRNFSPDSTLNSPITEYPFNPDQINTTSYLNHFSKHPEFGVIQQTWRQLLRSDQMTFKFCKDFNLQQIDSRQPLHDIICQLYTAYSHVVQNLKYINVYQVLFQYYRDLMKLIYKKKFVDKHHLILSTSKALSDSFELNGNGFLNQTKQLQLQRILSTKTNVVEDDQVTQGQKPNRTSDESKYHEYFLVEANKILKQKPQLHDSLLTQTLERIDQRKKQDMDENYQSSDQASSDLEYLNQERRNIKGMLSKKISHKVSRQTTQVEDESFVSQQSKIIKNVSLLQKISKLNALKRNQSYRHLDKSLKQINQNLKRKISEYFPHSEQGAPMLSNSEQLRSSSIKKLTTRLPLATEKSNMSRSQELSERQNVLGSFSERYIPNKQIPQTTDSTYSLLFNSTKGKSFINKQM